MLFNNFTFNSSNQSMPFSYFPIKCLIKFTRCPVTIETNSSPFRSGAGKLPYLEIGNEKFIGYRHIKKLLDKEVSGEI